MRKQITDRQNKPVAEVWPEAGAEVQLTRPRRRPGRSSRRERHQSRALVV